MGAKRCGFDGLGGGSTAARTDLESWRLVNCIVGKLPFGKIPLGCCRSGKSPWEVPYTGNKYEVLVNMVDFIIVN